MTFDATEFNETVAGIATIRDQLAEQIVTDAESEADTLQQETFLRIGITLIALLLAALMALLLTRSITRRLRAVSDKAHEVATIQLPALVSALRDPRGRSVIPDVAPIEDAGTDELGELAGAFNVVQSTLVDVAHEQIEVLRRGVSDIFVTMARRTRSLIDRQLALLDELEADVDDPSVLANYYQLDHLATRMRRNSESLLVLANAESRRRRTKATDVDDVVRAAIGEVEDYRRIDVLNLDHLQVRGAVVADISHLLAELLDNASSFSPPESRVTVSGRYADEHYLISISDEGVGIGADRLVELNDILANPPIVGLSVEPTLGMSVVSLLAHKHGVHVRLVPSSPGLLVEVVLPAKLYGPDRRDRAARRRAGDERSRHPRTRPCHRLVGVGRAGAHRHVRGGLRGHRVAGGTRRADVRHPSGQSSPKRPRVRHDVRRRDDRRGVHRRRRTSRLPSRRSSPSGRSRRISPPCPTGQIPRIRSTTRRPWRMHRTCSATRSVARRARDIRVHGASVTRSHGWRRVRSTAGTARVRHPAHVAPVHRSDGKADPRPAHRFGTAGHLRSDETVVAHTVARHRSRRSGPSGRPAHRSRRPADGTWRTDRPEFAEGGTVRVRSRPCRRPARRFAAAGAADAGSRQRLRSRRGHGEHVAVTPRSRIDP